MGPTPVGYGSVAEAGRIVTPLPPSDLGGYLSVYLRHSFNVPDPELISQLSLALVVDDGAIVWINGVELGRINVAPGDAAFNATSIEAHEGQQLDVRTNATSAAPVAAEFASNATAIFPPARRSPMIPEPTTVANRNAVPRNSATTRRVTLYGLLASNTADVIEALLQRESFREAAEPSTAPLIDQMLGKNAALNFRCRERAH